MAYDEATGTQTTVYAAEDYHIIHETNRSEKVLADDCVTEISVAYPDVFRVIIAPGVPGFGGNNQDNCATLAAAMKSVERGRVFGARAREIAKGFPR